MYRRDSLQSHTTCEGRHVLVRDSSVLSLLSQIYERFTVLSRSIAVILTGARKKCATVERSSGRHRRRRSCCWVSCGITKPSVQSNLTQSHIVAGPRSRIIQPYLPDSANVYPHLKDGSLGPREFLSQTAFRSVHPFLQDSQVCPSHRHRDRRTHRTPYITTYVAMSRICAILLNPCWGKQSNRSVTRSAQIHYIVYGTKVCRHNWHSAGSLGWPFSILKYKYTVSQKTRHLTFAHNFTKYWPIFKILSLLDSVGNV